MTVDVRATWGILLATDPGAPGLLRRRIFPESEIDVFLGIAWPSHNRLLILQVANSALSALNDLASTRAVRTSVISIDDNRSEIRIELAAPEMIEVFAPFVDDVAQCASAASDDRGAVAALRERFEHWRLLLAGNLNNGLSTTEALGVWGELWILRNVLHASWTDEAPDSWTAGDPDEKDFRLGPVSIEVKTTRTGHPQVVRINGEHQLEAPGAGGRVLLVVIEADAHEGGTGETLNEAVDAARVIFTGTVATRLEDRLVQRGYLSADEAQYRSTRYAARGVLWHEIAPGFPRITSSDLPVGVGDVHYLLDVDCCTPWRVEEAALGAILASATGSTS